MARDRGWDSYFAGQHYLNEGGNQGLQVVPYLARLASDAGDMTMGVGLLLAPLHNPVYTAETIATLDVISRGNMVYVWREPDADLSESVQVRLQETDGEDEVVVQQEGR